MRQESLVASRLSEAIFEHRLPPGTKLPEAELCRIFGTTRGFVRKVLSRLAGEHLIDLVPNRGAFVAKPTIDETRDVYELRRILEIGVVRALAQRALSLSTSVPPERWIEPLRAQIADEREANRLGDNARYIRLAGQFHLDLAAATGNDALAQHLKRVVAQTSLMVALYDVPGTNTCSHHEHMEILNAIETGDYAAAERLMEEHLVSIERQLRLGEEPQPVDLARALGSAGRDSTRGRNARITIAKAGRAGPSRTARPKEPNR